MGNGLMSDGEISVLMPAVLLPLDRETSSTTNQIILIDFLCSLALSFAHYLFAPQTLGILKRETKHGFAVKVVVFVF
jgi:hypothetical protein